MEEMFWLHWSQRKKECFLFFIIGGVGKLGITISIQYYFDLFLLHLLHKTDELFWDWKTKIFVTKEVQPGTLAFAASIKNVTGVHQWKFLDVIEE